MHTWDPERYLTYADERGRPFVELVARVGAESPATVVDLGCGPGNLTTLLRERWPDASVLGLDSSPEMVDQARAVDATITWQVGDLRTWASDGGEPVDVLVSNATLQWLPDHLDLLAVDLETGVEPLAHLVDGLLEQGHAGVKVGKIASLCAAVFVGYFVQAGQLAIALQRGLE